MLIDIVYLDSPTDDNFHQIKKGNFGRQKLLFTFFFIYTRYTSDKLGDEFIRQFDFKKANFI